MLQLKRAIKIMLSKIFQCLKRESYDLGKMTGESSQPAFLGVNFPWKMSFDFNSAIQCAIRL